MNLELNFQHEANPEDLESFERAMAELEEKSMAAEEVSRQINEEHGERLAEMGLGFSLRPQEIGGELDPQFMAEPDRFSLKGIPIYVPKSVASAWVKPDSGGSCWFSSGNIQQSTVDQSQGKLSLRACVSSSGLANERATGGLGVFLSSMNGVPTHYEVIFHYIASVRTAWELPQNAHGNQHNSFGVGAVVWDVSTPGQSAWVRGVPGISRDGYYSAFQSPSSGDHQFPMPNSSLLKVPIMVEPGKRYMIVLTPQIQVSAANSKGYLETEVELVEWA